ncbi:MAG: C10 family peptidase, partial [Bacteroidales bacterium]|nr:C10 family peptidase [Bacteroidales bacterium]
MSVAQALEVGYTFMRTNGHDRGNGNVRKQAMQLVYTGAVTDSLTRTVTDCYYVFALQPMGFVMVSADERVKPILGYSYSNDFVVEDMPDNILFWLDNYKKQIKAVVDNDYQADPATITSWSLLKSGQSVAFRSGTSVNPLLQTTWNQNCYYNQLCPEDAAGPCGHAYAGCVATAMAQVMHYWGWPTQGFNSHSYTCDYGTLSVDFSTATYNHGNMPNALTYSTSASQKEEVAKFIYHCGVAVDMGYGADGSGAYSSDVPSALYNYFAYTDNGTYRSKSNYSESGWTNLIKQELNNMRPVYYAGHGTGGHAFVCDGYDENNLFHFNWGWSGSNDGYFELSTLNPSSYNFSESQAAVTGVTAGTFIRCSESELSFSARVGEQSSAKSITVCAHGLSGSISVAVGNGFKVSKNGILYYTSLTLPASGGTLYVKYVPTQSGDVLDSLTLTSGSCSARVYLNGTDNVIVGDGPATSIYLPSHSYYKYALTQQIYTPAEIGTSGYIRSIAFYNSGTEKTRNYDMYLVLTDKDTFANGTDWIAVSEDDKVFSGEVTMAEGTWTTFQIDNFPYDGVSNLALIMDDNTGSYSSGMACKVFNAENRTLRIYSDGTNYDPVNPGAYTGTVDDQKNQIKIDINPSAVVICEKPKNLAFSNLTQTSVSVSWSNGSGNFGYEYKKTSETEWTVGCAGNCGFNCNLTGLTPNTSYQFRVHSICADSTTSGWLTGSFSTPAGIPLVEPFDNTTKPDGWLLYTGLLNNVMEGTATLATATSGWTFGTGNGVFNSHARTNIYGTSWYKWLVTPTLLMEDNVQLSFDLALTKYSGNLQQPVDTLQQDDKFVVLITSDNGATWEILRQWDNTGSEYVYNHIVCSANGEFVTIDLSGYAGRNIAVAFYGESTVSGGDNNLHIDNVRIDYIPTCEAPTALTVTDVTAHTASLSWESDAINWQICLNGDETNLINATSDSYTFTDLIPETVYTVKVRANCIMGLQSPWSEEVSFMPTYRVVIGSGTGTNSYLPTNVNNKYSLTQQIYTVAELGEAGNIVSIDFHKNNNEECARNLDIYMVSTDKGSFTGTNDWIPVTDANKVFGGTVNFADNDWTTITLDRPFSYDGTNNIAIMVDDNSGRTVSATPFLAFPAGNQALRICGRTTNYRATTGSYTGTIESSKNQIRIMKVDYALICDAPADLTVSEIDHQGATVNWNGEADSWIVAYRPANAELFTEVNVNTTSYTLTGLDASTNYTVKVAAKCGNETVWGEDVNFTTLSTPCPVIVLDNNGTYTENFDHYTPSTTAATGVEPDCWEVINEDVALTEATMPQVYYNANFATSGSYTLRMKNR